MNHQLSLAGFEGQAIEVQPPSALAGPKLLVNGQPAPKGKKRGEMLLRRSDGTEVTARWKPVLMGWDTPQLEVGGQTVPIVEPLTWYEWLWSALPLLLVFAGGLLGGLAGAIALAINTRVFRSNLHVAARYVLTGVVSLIAVAAYVVAVTVLYLVIGR